MHNTAHVHTGFGQLNEASSPGSISLVVIEDNAAHLAAIERAFAGSTPAVEVRHADSLDAYRRFVAGQSPDIALMDLHLPDGKATEVLSFPPEAGRFPVILMTSHGSESLAVEAMKEGALDYIVKSAEVFAEMPRIVSRALREWNLLRERALAAAALRESEERYRRIAETITDYIYTVEIQDGKAVKTTHGPGCVAVTGYSAGEFAANRLLWIRMVKDEDTAAVLEQASHILKEQKPSSIEHRIVCKDGSERWVRSTLVPKVGARGTLEQYDGLIQDITARKRAEATLVESENKYRHISGQFNALLNAMPDSITMLAPDLTVLWANRTACHHHEEPADLIGGCCYALWHKRSVPCDQCPALATVQTGEPCLETRTSPDGRIWELRTVPVKENGTIVSVIAIGRDLSEHRRLEAQLIQAQKMESIGVLAGGIAHDFNNILTAIMGYGEIALLQMPHDIPYRKHIQSMLEGAGKAAYLTQGLLAFSRKRAMNKKSADLCTIVSNVEKFLSRVIGEDVQYRTVIPSFPLPVFADPNQIEQVLMNLATNARDAMDGGGLLTITVDKADIDEKFIALHGYGAPGAYGLITVSDSGVGMDAAVLAKIFDPFFTTKEAGRGTGLGLAIIYGIVKEHDGHISVYSEPGMGTTFRIYLPIMQGSVPAAAAAAHYPRRGTETILLVEDDAYLRNLTTIVLKEFGYAVFSAADAETAIRMFRENRSRIDLLLSDIVLPGKSGKEAAEEILKMRSGLPVLFTSGYPAEYLQRKGIFSEAFRLVMKPVSPLELLNAVREELDKKRTPAL